MYKRYLGTAATLIPYTTILLVTLKLGCYSDNLNVSMAKRQTIIVSERGQITLPQEIRKKLGIKAGMALVAQEERGKVVLMPAAVTPMEIYSDEEIQSWLAQDKISNKERKAILKKAGRR